MPSRVQALRQRLYVLSGARPTPIRARTTRTISRTICATPTIKAQLQSLPLPARSVPSAYASSSRLTLDYFDFPLDLSFARDDELLQSLLAPVPWLDASTAYLGLRASSLFTHHLSLLAPHAGALYERLKPSGLHGLLVSDLLLRHPDPFALRTVLEHEAGNRHGDRLRSSLVAQAHAILRPHLQRRTIARLSRPASLLSARALIDANSADAVPALVELYWDLVSATDWTPESAWHVLDVARHVARHDADEALRMLQFPINLGKLPSAATGRSSRRHPRVRELVVLGVILRTALAWGLHARARAVADDVLAVLVESGTSQSAFELLLQAARCAAVAKDAAAAAWAGDHLIRLAQLAPVPRSTLDFYVSSLDPRLGADYLLRFIAETDTARSGRPPRLAPQTALRVARAVPSRAILDALIPTVATAVDSPERTAMLCLLADARADDPLRALLAVDSTGRGRPAVSHLSPGAVITLVRALMRGYPDHALARRLLARYSKHAASSAPLRDPGGAKHAEVVATRLHAQLLIAPDTDDALAALREVIALPDPPAMVTAITSSDPLLAGQLQQLAQRLSVADRARLGAVSPALAFASACLRNARSLVPVPDSLRPGERRLVHALRAMQRRQLTKAVQLFVRATKDMDGAAGATDTALVVLVATSLARAARNKAKWDAGLAVLVAAARVLPRDVAALADAAVALLMAMRKAGVDVPSQHAETLQAAMDSLDPVAKERVAAACRP